MLHAMEFGAWLRPPRQLLLVCAGVAALSVGVVGWLGWLLFQQDAALEVQRRQERLEDAADRTASAMQRAVADLQVLANTASPPDRAATSVAVLAIAEDVVAVHPPGPSPRRGLLLLTSAVVGLVGGRAVFHRTGDVA